MDKFVFIVTARRNGVDEIKVVEWDCKSGSLLKAIEELKKQIEGWDWKPTGDDFITVQQARGSGRVQTVYAILGKEFLN